MFFRKKKKEEGISEKAKKTAKTFDKIMTGVIIGGAIGSALGVALSDKKNRQKIKKKSQEAYEKGKEFVENHGEEWAKEAHKKSKGVWSTIKKKFFQIISSDEEDF